MLTRELLRREMAVSEANEERIYKQLTLDLFRGIQDELKSLYDQTVAATGDFTAITKEAIRSNPKTVKTLRYCLAPVISQMRLGQIIELSTTEAFEEQGVVPTEPQAERLARWFNDYLDRDRFQWLTRSAMSAAEKGLADTYAKLWTVSLQSNQNTATRYRTQRKEMQEKAIADALGRMGLKLQTTLGIPPVTRPRRKKGDPPHLPTARRHQPRRRRAARALRQGEEDTRRQPEEAEVGSDGTPVGGRRPVLYRGEGGGDQAGLDKAVEGLNDKYTDWKGSSLPITTVGVVAGMFSGTDLEATIKLRQIPIFFEHDLDKLNRFLTSRDYYGSPWNPAVLFDEVTKDELAEALEKIRTAPVDDEDATEQKADPNSAVTEFSAACRCRTRRLPSHP